MNKEAGFFLMETIFLGMILGAVALVCYSYVALNQQRLYCESAVTAAFLSQEQIALLEAKPDSYLRSAGEVPWLGAGGNPVQRNGRSFQMTTRVTDAGESPDIRSIEVTVQWDEGGRWNQKIYRKLVLCR